MWDGELKGCWMGIMFMRRVSGRWGIGAGLWLACVLSLALPGLLLARGTTEQGAAASVAPKVAPVVGTVKAIAGAAITLATDAGAEWKITVADDARILRVPTGSKDLKAAAPIQIADLQAGDRILVRGKTGADGNSMLANSVIAMSKADIAEKQAHEREEWQRHGIGGLVKSADAASGTIVIGTMSAAGSKDVTIHAGKALVRRYAPDSVKFDEAKPSTLAEIKAGDQVRARGGRSEDGAEFTAEEIVAGSFRNIAGTIVSVDAGAGLLIVADLATKKNVQVKMSSDSQARKLPVPMAQRLAARLKGVAPDASAAGAAGAAAGQLPGGGAQGQMGVGPAGMAGAGRGGDLQQMLSRLPVSTLGDFQKGEAVMLVATEGKKDGVPTAITLLGGVELLLQASPEGQASILTPWSLSQGGGGEAGAP